MTITLTPEIERALAIEATRQGTSPEDLALGCLRTAFVRQEPRPLGQAKNLAEFLGDSIGCISSDEFIPGGARMSENTGKKFTEGLLKKKQEGRL